MRFEDYREIAEIVIRDHMARGECLFAPNAAENIAYGVIADVWSRADKEDVINVLVRHIKAAEIYCPHEGIDRRAEFGIAA
jgi:hypothetical protein